MKHLREVDFEILGELMGFARAAEVPGLAVGAALDIADAVVVDALALRLRLGDETWPATASAALSGSPASVDRFDGAVLKPEAIAIAGISRASTGWFRNEAKAFQSAAVDIVRLNWRDGVAQGVLVEDQRTNSVRNNTMQGGGPGAFPTNWAMPAASGVTPSVVGVGVQDGVSYVDIRLQSPPTGATATGGVTLRPETSAGIAAIASDIWTFSAPMAVVAGTQKSVQLVVEQRSASATLNTYQTAFRSDLGSQLPDDPMAVTAAFDSNGATAYARLGIQVTGWAVGEVVDVTYRIGMPQMEKGRSLTSIIPTSTVAVTRSAEVVSGNLGPEFNPRAQTMLARFRRLYTPTTGSAGRLWQWDDGTEDNRISCRLSGNALVGEVVKAGVVIATVGPAAIRGKVDNRVAFGFSRNTLRLSVNGMVYEAGLASLPGGLSKRRIGSAAVAGLNINAPVMPYLNHPTKRSRDASEYARLLTANEMRAYTRNGVFGLPRYASIVGIGDSYTAGDKATPGANRFLNKIAASMEIVSPLNQGLAGTVLQNSPGSANTPLGNNGRDRYVAATLGGNKREGVIDGYGGFNDARYTAAPSSVNLTNYLTDKRQVWEGWLAGGYDAGDIVACSIWWVTNAQLAIDGISRGLCDDYFDAVHKLALEYGVYWADCYNPMKTAHAAFLAGTGPQVLDADGVHPNNAGHAVIHQAVMAAQRAWA